MDSIFTDYNNCLTNLSNSILNYYGFDTYHNTLKDIDEILTEKEYKNIVLVLYDGMGSRLLERVLSKRSFLYKHKLRDFNAVFPPTTTASTTSILSGLNPNEHGWLGWDLFFKEVDKTVSLFPNTIKDTDIPAADNQLAEDKYPYESIVKKIGTKVNSVGLYPFKETKYDGLDNMMKYIKDICKNNENNFIYAYYPDPDHTMHLTGTDSKETKESFKMINEKTKKLCKSLKDTLVIIIADHGHINSTPIVLSDYPDVFNLLERDTSIEPRACSLKIKGGKEKEFKKLFNNYFGDDFILLNKKEVIDKKIFGTGKNNIYFDEAIGDYVAIAKTNKYIKYDYKGNMYLSMHAGSTADEVLVPIIIYKG